MGEGKRAGCSVAVLCPSFCPRGWPFIYSLFHLAFFCFTIAFSLQENNIISCFLVALLSLVLTRDKRPHYINIIAKH